LANSKAEYEITFTRTARKELEILDNRIVRRIIRKIESLASNARPTGCEKFKGHENLWRVRVGDYRIVYSVNDKMRIIDITLIRHRKDAYR
jgi:mRNA interferase RelE/StbE